MNVIIMRFDCVLTCDRHFKNPSANMAIAVDVAVQNCIFRNVTEHLRLYKIGSSMPNAMHDWRKQHPQLTTTKTGCCWLECFVDWKMFRSGSSVEIHSVANFNMKRERALSVFLVDILIFSVLRRFFGYLLECELTKNRQTLNFRIVCVVLWPSWWTIFIRVIWIDNTSSWEQCGINSLTTFHTSVERSEVPKAIVLTLTIKLNGIFCILRLLSPCLHLNSCHFVADWMRNQKVEFFD